jgi:hypothetical protein
VKWQVVINTVEKLAASIARVIQEECVAWKHGCTVQGKSGLGNWHRKSTGKMMVWCGQSCGFNTPKQWRMKTRKEAGDETKVEGVPNEDSKEEGQSCEESEEK